MRCLSSNATRKIVIIGGGPVGFSSAVHLARMGLGNEIVVVERDLTYSNNSAMLSAGGIRQQFSLKENIQLSLYSLDFLRKMDTLSCQDGTDTSVQFKPNGYLFLGSTETGKDTLKGNTAVQHAQGADWIKYTENMQELQQVYPWLYTDDILAATYSQGTGEGYFDPWAYVNALKREAQTYGVKVLEGLVVGAKMMSKGNNGSHIIDALEVQHSKTSERSSLNVSQVVNCAGAYAGQITEMLARAAVTDGDGIFRLPIQPRKRQVFSVHCPGLAQFSQPSPTSAAPLTVDPTGVWFRGEGNVCDQGGHFICGRSPPQDLDPDCENDEALQHVDHDWFEEAIWPVLAERVPAFNELKVKNSWAGFYDFNTIDENLILGMHPQISNMLHCNGLSGHGLQMSPGAGRAVAEYLQHGKSTSINLENFSMDRIISGKPYLETGIV